MFFLAPYYQTYLGPPAGPVLDITEQRLMRVVLVRQYVPARARLIVIGQYVPMVRVSPRLYRQVHVSRRNQLLPGAPQLTTLTSIRLRQTRAVVPLPRPRFIPGSTITVTVPIVQPARLKFYRQPLPYRRPLLLPGAPPPAIFVCPLRQRQTRALFPLLKQRQVIPAGPPGNLPIVRPPRTFRTPAPQARIRYAVLSSVVVNNVPIVIPARKIQTRVSWPISKRYIMMASIAALLVQGPLFVSAASTYVPGPQRAGRSY